MSFEVGKSFGGGRTERSGGGKREFQVSGAGSRGRLGRRRFKNAEVYNPKIAVDRGLYLLVPKKTRTSWKSIFHGTIRISFCFVPPARPGETTNLWTVFRQIAGSSIFSSEINFRKAKAFVKIIDSSIYTHHDQNYDSNEVRGPPRSGGSEGKEDPKGV